MSESTFELTKKTIYAHGSLGMPLAVIGYPLAIWIPAHYSGGLGNQPGGCWDHSDVGSFDRRCHGPFNRRDI